MGQRFTGKDYLFLATCIGICLVSLVIGIEYFSKAFPEASIDFQVTRSDSKPLAVKFLKEQGWEPVQEGYRHNAIFSHDNRAKVFLEKELGLEEANQFMGSPIRLWRWRHRWFKPLQKEEFRIDISPSGELIGFNHLIPEEMEGDDLSQEQALPIAEQFLQEPMEFDLSSYEFLEATTEERPNRTDHTFLWKKKDFDINDATYRMEVKIKGDEIGGYREFLKIPEKWSRDYEKLRSLNDTTGLGAGFFLFLTILAILIVFLNKVRNRDIRLKTAIMFGLVGFVLQFISQLNLLPLTESGYVTTDSYGSFIANEIFSAFLGALGSGLFIVLLTCAAESLYREHYGNKISLSNMFRWRGIRTKKFFLGIVLGFTLTFLFFAYENIFYLIAQKMGAWSPAEIPYSNLLNSKIPWIFVLFIGFFPAVTEEFMSRMFSIPFLKKYLKSTWFAVLISSIIWGFAHANYPNQPFFIRGVEVGIVGIILGFTMVRFGILPTLVAHFTIDAFYAAFLMFRSGNPYFVLSASLAAGILLIPLLVALVSYIKNGSFSNEEVLLNEVEGTSRVPRIEEESREFHPVVYQPLSRERITIGIVGVVLLLGLFFLKVEKFGKFIDFPITKGEAKEIADDFLNSKEVDVEEYQSVPYTYSSFNPLSAQYILKKRGVKELNRSYGETKKSFFWAIRYFIPEEKEEYKVFVDPLGREVYSYQHLIKEDAEGAQLEEENAREIAEDYLLSKGYILNDFELKESSSEKKKERMDHEFEWEAKDESGNNVEDAKFRLVANIQGDEIARFSQYYKVPEEWEREQRKNTITDALLSGLQIALTVAFFLFGFWVFVGTARKGEIRWKPVLFIALGLTGIVSLSILNSFSTVFQHYGTSYPWKTFILGILITDSLSLIGIFLMFALSIGLITSLYPDSLNLLHRENRAQWARDAVLSGLLIVGGAFGLEQGKNMLIEHFPNAVQTIDLPVPTSIETPLPFIESFSGALWGLTAFPVLIGLIINILQSKRIKPIYIMSFTVLALIVFGSGDAKSLGESLFGITNLIISLAFLFLFIKYFLRDNLLAYALSGFLWIGSRSVFSLFSLSAPFYKINGVILLVLLVLPLAWLVLVSHGRSGYERRIS
jgi:membrane protease YdiL (CAAX protease family)